MKPAEFKQIRQSLGLSVKEMAEALRLSDERSVRRYEDGTREISGPIQQCLVYMLRYGGLDKTV